MAALSCFDDRSHSPTPGELKTALGSAYSSWTAVQDLVRAAAPAATAEWGYTSATTGWGLRLKLGKRVLLYLTPRQGSFLASTALGEKAVTLAETRRFPASFLELLAAAPRYAEGRGIRMRVTSPREVRMVARLLELKLAT